MKILFVTTFGVPWQHEHYFTKNVGVALAKAAETAGHTFRSVSFTYGLAKLAPELQQQPPGTDYDILDIASSADDAHVLAFEDYFRKIKPDIIHSNMIEGWDIAAAKNLNIPIVTTLHLGAFLCPRGGGQGFLKYDDSICNQPVSRDCDRCMATRLPLPGISYAIHKILPRSIEKAIAKKLSKPAFYLSAFLRQVTEPEAKLRLIELAKYSHLIAANSALENLLRINGLEERVHLLPHGIAQRKHLPLPSLSPNSPVKFFFIGTTHYSKGLHVLIKAFQSVPNNLYELHIIGDVYHCGKKEKAYFENIKKQSKKLNIFFDGRVENDALESKIADYHVMIHSAIFHEVYGLTIAESLSMGRPVISTRCGGAEMQVIDGHNGWLVQPNDSKDLHRAIMEAINNPNEIMRRAANATTPHCVDDYAKKLLALYANIIQNHPQH